MENYKLDVNYLLDGKNLSKQIGVDLNQYTRETNAADPEGRYGDYEKKNWVRSLLREEFDENVSIVNDVGELVGELECGVRDQMQ